MPQLGSFVNAKSVEWLQMNLFDACVSGGHGTDPLNVAGIVVLPRNDGTAQDYFRI